VLVPGSLERLALKPWSQLIPLFLTMIIGGGLEELGWRGVAQPELERRLSRAAAALVVGVVWALWHLPLFYLPGVGQYGTSFAIFALQVVGLAFILAWLYAATRSILFCVIFHAATNAALAMGITTPTGHSGPAVAGAVLKLILGVVLVFAIRQRSSNP
jgi:membrane protease YdiL (CAAX protease family)